MDKVLEVFWAIRGPRRITLQDESIWSLQHFLKGYSARMLMQACESGMPGLFRGFEHWLD